MADYYCANTKQRYGNYSMRLNKTERGQADKPPVQPSVSRHDRYASVDMKLETAFATCCVLVLVEAVDPFQRIGYCKPLELPVDDSLIYAVSPPDFYLSRIRSLSRNVQS